MYKIIDLEQGSEEWLEARREKFNASETPIVFGVSPYSFNGLEDLYLLKTQQKKVKENIAMKKGSEAEEYIRKFVNDYLGAAYKPAVIESVEDNRFRASLDGLDEKASEPILEIKYSNKIFKDAQKAEKSGGDIRIDLYLQLQHQMLVSGFKTALFVACKEVKDLGNINRDDVVMLLVDADKNLQKTIKKKWDEYDKLDKTKIVKEVEVEVEEDKQELIEARNSIKEQIGELKEQLKELEETKKAIEEELKAYLPKDLAFKVANIGGVKFTKVKRKSIDYKKLLKDKGIREKDTLRYIKYSTYYKVD